MSKSQTEMAMVKMSRYKSESMKVEAMYKTWLLKKVLSSVHARVDKEGGMIKPHLIRELMWQTTWLKKAVLS